MASRAAKAVRFTIAWLVVPAIFAATGYYIIGPSLGNSPSKPSNQIEDPLQTDGPSEDESEPKNFQPPNIEVSVKKGSTVSQRDIRRPVRKKKPVPKTEPAAAPAAPASSGGGETVPVGE